MPARKIKVIFRDCFGYEISTTSGDIVVRRDKNNELRLCTKIKEQYPRSIKFFKKYKVHDIIEHRTEAGIIYEIICFDKFQQWIMFQMHSPKYKKLTIHKQDYQDSKLHKLNIRHHTHAKKSQNNLSI